MGEFKHLSALVIDPSGHSKKLLRTILVSIGLHRIWPVSHTNVAIDTLRRQAFDIVFCDENVGPLSPESFIKALRCDLTTSNVTIPVVLISCGMSRNHVSAWRDAGGSDVIVKPLSPETLRLRLKSLVWDPKDFVTAKSFIGPDRRRSDGAERRQFGERRPLGLDRRLQSGDGAVFPLPRSGPRGIVPEV